MIIIHPKYLGPGIDHTNVPFDPYRRRNTIRIGRALRGPSRHNPSVPGERWSRDNYGEFQSVEATICPWATIVVYDNVYIPVFNGRFPDLRLSRDLSCPHAQPFQYQEWKQ